MRAISAKPPLRNEETLMKSRTKCTTRLAFNNLRQETWYPTQGWRDALFADVKTCDADTVAAAFRAGVNSMRMLDNLTMPLLRKEPTSFVVLANGDALNELSRHHFGMVIAVMRSCPQHVFQLVMDFPSMLDEHCSLRDLPENVWIGIKVAKPRHLQFIEELQLTGAKTRFVYFDPRMDTDVGEINLTGIHQVIISYKTDDGEISLSQAFIESIQRNCKKQGVPYCFAP